jgi:hypothetical protein
VQGHISHPVGEIVCDSLDKLAILGLPIWITELDVTAENEHIRADDLEVFLREAFAHPAVEGIILWGFWEMFMFREHSHLVDADGTINEAGKRYLALKQEWLTRTGGNVDHRESSEATMVHTRWKWTHLQKNWLDPLLLTRITRFRPSH